MQELSRVTAKVVTTSKLCQQSNCKQKIRNLMALHVDTDMPVVMQFIKHPREIRVFSAVRCPTLT